MPLTAVGRDVLHTEQRRLRAAEVAPFVDQLHVWLVPVDPAEEVVRREEHQVAAEIAETLHEVVEAPGHVLGVPGEHDQVVGRAQRAAEREGLDILVGVHVDVLAGLGEPVLERRS